MTDQQLNQQVFVKGKKDILNYRPLIFLIINIIIAIIYGFSSDFKFIEKFAIIHLALIVLCFPLVIFSFLEKLNKISNILLSLVLSIPIVFILYSFLLLFQAIFAFFDILNKIWR